MILIIIKIILSLIVLSLFCIVIYSILYTDIEDKRKGYIRDDYISFHIIGIIVLLFTMFLILIKIWQ